MGIRQAYSWVGHRLRECGVYLQYLVGFNKKPTIFFSVSDSVSGFSSELRGSHIAKHWRSLGINALVLPAQLEISQRARLGKLLRPDIVIHQTFRHEGSNPELFPLATNIVDLDDADFLDPRIEPKMRDRAGFCHGGIGGSRFTERWLRNHIENTTVVWTGTPVLRRQYNPPSTRPTNRVVWATTSPLADELDAALIREVVESVSHLAGFEFMVIGRCSERALRKYIDPVLQSPDQLIYKPYMSYERLLDTLESCVVGLAPLVLKPGSFNQGKSFGKILAYIGSGVPVVTSDAADHSVFFESGVNGFCSNKMTDWTNAITSLLEDPSLRDSISRNAAEALSSKLSLERSSTLELEFVEHVHSTRLQETKAGRASTFSTEAGT